MIETLRLVSSSRRTHFLPTFVCLLNSAAVNLRFRCFLRKRMSVFRFSCWFRSIRTGSRSLISPTEFHSLLKAVRLFWVALSLTSACPVSVSLSISRLAMSPSNRSSLISAPLRCHRSRLHLVQAGKQFLVEMEPPLSRLDHMIHFPTAVSALPGVQHRSINEVGQPVKSLFRLLSLPALVVFY